MSTDANEFASDGPLTNKLDDRLNRAPFAERIASILCNLPRGAGLVVGIHGPWGDGKTTVLNLIRESLVPRDEVIVRDFNPWRITEEDALLRGFFLVLAEAIGASLSTKIEDLGARASKLAKAARWFTGIFGVFSRTGDMVDKLLNRFSEAVHSGDSRSIEELRSRIVHHLDQSSKRVVILVDDIDRLDKEEIYTVFRLIKACADFPNVCYVVAFDDAVVASALNERYGGGQCAGRAFLEKVVQVPLKLPIAAREDLRALCFEQVNRALDAAGVELTREQVGEFVSGFDRSASVRLTTPRAAKRYGNGLAFALPALKDETNPVDVLLVEALRAFFPEVFGLVRENHPDFSGVESEHRRRDEEPRAARLLNPVLDRMPQEEAEAVKALLVDLFPRLGRVYGNTSYGIDWLERWSRERRICSPEYCARYFTYAIPRNDVADSGIACLLEAASRGDTAAVESKLAALLTDLRAARVVEKLRGVENTVDPKAAAVIAVAMARRGGSLPSQPSLFSFAEPVSQAAILISHLIRRVSDRSTRVDITKEVLKRATPLSFGVECIRWLYVTDKEEKQDQNTLTKQELADARSVLTDRIKTYAKEGAPLFDPARREEHSLLYEWSRAEGRNPVQSHLVSVFTEDPRQIARFLESQAPLAWTANSALPRVSELREEQLKNIGHLISLDVLADLVREHCPGDFENPRWVPGDTRPLDERLAEQFMYVYLKIKRGERAPSDVHDPDQTEENPD